jgi:tRNA threonylcarbamoyladenosine biosynthesis protein TsaB
VRDVVVADGPGSFTGLRVGAAVGKAIAAARPVTLWTVPALLARALATAHHGEVVVAALDALRGELYAAAWRVEKDGVVPVLPAAARSPEGLRAALAAPDALVGEAPPALAERLLGWAGRTELGGRADAGLLLAATARPGAVRRIDDVAAWEPTYGRPAEAQARWEAEHGRPLPDPARASR